MRKVISTAAVATVLVALPAVAAAQADPAKPEPAKPPASIAGKWTLMIDPGQGPMQLPMELKLDGKKLTGTIIGPQGDPAQLEGEFADGKATWVLTVEGGAMQITFKAALKEDGSLAGTLVFDAGEFAWTATRVKDQ